MSHYDEQEQKAVDESMVYTPKHYNFFEDTEAIQIIASAMSDQQFYGYCMGNKLKYVLRASKKNNPMEDLKKADFYEELYRQNRQLCIGNK